MHIVWLFSLLVLAARRQELAVTTTYDALGCLLSIQFAMSAHHMSCQLQGSVLSHTVMSWLLHCRLKASEAATAGIVSRVVPADQLMQEAVNVAKKIARYTLPCCIPF